MIKVSQGCLGEAELDAIKNVFPEGYFGHTAATVAFEAALSGFLATPHVVAVNTGTSALHLALDALGIGADDEVILPSLTFIAAFQAVRATGATPVACDVDPVTLCADLNDVTARITPRTKAIMPMHYAGQPCDMDGFLRLKEKTGIRIVEDAAHAFGSSYQGKRIGSFGDITCFSFDSIKNITCGEGGAIVCRESQIAEILRTKRRLGIALDSASLYEFDVATSGYRYHLGAINAAVGLTQLKRLPEFILRRREICRRYVAAFSNVSGIELIATNYDETAPHVFVIRVKDGRRDALMRFLYERDIETRIHYVPNHLHALFKSKTPLPVTESLYREVLTLPLHCALTDAQVAQIIAAIRNF